VKMHEGLLSGFVWIFEELGRHRPDDGSLLALLTTAYWMLQVCRGQGCPESPQCECLVRACSPRVPRRLA
jgi:hypothetical protein